MKDRLKDISESIVDIDGTNNRIIQLSNMDSIPDELTHYSGLLMKLTEGSGTLQELQDAMIARDGEAKILKINGIRVANVIGISGIHVRRKVSDIIIPNGVAPIEHETNMGSHVLDPYGFASESITPDVLYSLLGKFPFLRPGSDDFNQELFSTIMNQKVNFEPVGAALEMSEREDVYMPAYKIDGLYQLLKEFSVEREKEDISTAKHHLINL